MYPVHGVTRLSGRSANTRARARLPQGTPCAAYAAAHVSSGNAAGYFAASHSSPAGAVGSVPGANVTVPASAPKMPWNGPARGASDVLPPPGAGLRKTSFQRRISTPIVRYWPEAK